jgi:DNA-binding phage protein
MTTSHKMPTTTTLTGDVLSAGDLAYFRERQSNRVYEAVFKAFVNAGIMKADLARKLKRKPEQITRWLSGPGNWTLDTVSDLLLALGSEMAFVVTKLTVQPRTAEAGREPPSIEIIERAESGPRTQPPSAPISERERSPLTSTGKMYAEAA